MGNDSSRLSELKIELNAIKKQIPFWTVETILLILASIFLLAILTTGVYIIVTKYDNTNPVDIIFNILGLLYFSLITFGITIAIIGSSIKAIIEWIFKKLRINTTIVDKLIERRNELHKLIKHEKWKMSIEDINKESEPTIEVKREIKETKQDETKIAVNNPKPTNPTTQNQKINDRDRTLEFKNKSDKLENETKADVVGQATNTTEEFLDNLFSVNAIQDNAGLEEKLKNPIKKSHEDYIEENKIKQSIGYEGEILVLNYEKEILKRKNRSDLADMVQHVSKEIGDGLGYDIISYDESGNKKFIEVKTTTKKETEGFYVTDSELKGLKSMSNYHIYRVFDFDLSTKQGIIFKISSIEDFNKYFTAVAVNYRVTPKR